MTSTTDTTTTNSAFTGLAGDLVRLLEPATESDPWAVLTTMLAAFAGAVGQPGPHALVGGQRHPMRLNVLVVGATAHGRKGSSWAAVSQLLAQGCPEYVAERVIHGGLSTAEGLVAELQHREGLDASVTVLEPEFGRVLLAARRGSLSAVIRQLFDNEDVRVLTRSKPLKAHANLNVVGHVTAQELRRLGDGEVSNGFLNRFLFCWSERSKLLPSGGMIDPGDLEIAGVQLGVAIDRARGLTAPLRRSLEAEERWRDIYFQLAADNDEPGPAGLLKARGVAHILRLSTVYAAFDASTTVELGHLEAALACWRHAEQSIDRIFGGKVPDPWVAQLLAALEEAGSDGLDGAAQRTIFGRHQPERLAAAPIALEDAGTANTVVEATAGRPKIITRAVTPDRAHLPALNPMVLAATPSPPPITDRPDALHPEKVSEVQRAPSVRATNRGVSPERS
jgi:hypothetical protein